MSSAPLETPSPTAESLLRGGRVSWAILAMAGLTALIGVILWTFRVILPPLILAGAIAFLLNPAVSGLARRGVHRVLGTAITYLAVLGGITLIVFLVVPLATDQANQFAETWPEIEQRSTNFIEDLSERSQGTFLEFTPSELSDALDGGDQTLAEQLAQARKIGLQLFHVLLILVLGPIIAFYLLMDLPHLVRVGKDLVPPSARYETEIVMRRLNRAIGGFFRGQLVVALVVGVMVSVGLATIGLKFWFLIGMIAGLFNMIPLVGPWVGGIPGVVIALTTGDNLQALGVVVVMVVAQQIDNHFITPQVMQRAVSLHPAAVVLALLAGGSLGGFLGLLLAVPVAAALKIVCGHLWRTRVLGETPPLGALDPSELDDPPTESTEAAEVGRVGGDPNGDPEEKAPSAPGPQAGPPVLPGPPVPPVL